MISKGDLKAIITMIEKEDLKIRCIVSACYDFQNRVIFKNPLTFGKKFAIMYIYKEEEKI